MNPKVKGNLFEREAAFRLRSVFPNCRTSQFNGRLFDDRQGIDLSDTPGYFFQCKNSERLPKSYHSILAQMPKTKNVNVILHKKENEGIVAVMDFDNFLKLIKNAKSK